MNASRLPRTLAVLLSTVATALAGTPAGADAAPIARSALAGALSHELTIAGPLSGAYVFDLTTEAPLFSERAEVARPPASVEKLYTATAALELMGPGATLSTTVLGSGHLGAN